MKSVENPEFTTLFRVENPNIPADPRRFGQTSHEDLVGQWFSPNLDTAMHYLRKSTQTFGQNASPVDGAQLVIAQVPIDQVESYHVTKHSLAKDMDVENDNYIIPEGQFDTKVVPLDEILSELRGKLGNLENLREAKQRVIEHLGSLSLT